MQKSLRDCDICFGIGDIEKEWAKKNWEGMVSKKADWLAFDDLVVLCNISLLITHCKKTCQWCANFLCPKYQDKDLIGKQNLKYSQTFFVLVMASFLIPWIHNMPNLKGIR